MKPQRREHPGTNQFWSSWGETWFRCATEGCDMPAMVFEMGAPGTRDPYTWCCSCALDAAPAHWRLVDTAHDGWLINPPGGDR